MIASLAAAEADSPWSVELFSGSAYDLKTRLAIDQSGQQEIRLSARYHTRPFSDSPYYAWRISNWKNDRAWELELVHHKLYLVNNPPEVQHFEITHGYNLLMFNRARKRGGLIYRAGAGLVVSHAESTIRGESLDSGYRLAGPSAQIAVGKRIDLSKHLFFTPEGKLTAAYARVRVVDGHATAPNVAFHGLFGIGYRL